MSPMTTKVFVTEWYNISKTAQECDPWSH